MHTEAVRTNCSHTDAGFPVLKLALRYALTDTKWCLATGGQTELYLVRRSRAPTNPVPDLLADDLDSLPVIKEVLTRHQPSLRFDSRAAIAVVAEYLADERPRARLAELVEDVSEGYPVVPAEMLRMALGLCINAGVLVSDDLGPDRLLTLRSDLDDGPAVLTALRNAAREALTAHRWPHDEDILKALIPEAGFLGE